MRLHDRWQALWVILPSLFYDGSECRLSCRGLFPLRRVRLTLCRLFAKVGMSVSKGLVVFPPLHITAFLHVLHTGLCSLPGTGTFLVSCETKVHPHHALGVFFLSKVGCNSAISLQTKSSGSHMTSCLVSCRIASPTCMFSSVSVRNTGKRIYCDKEILAI